MVEKLITSTRTIKDITEYSSHLQFISYYFVTKASNNKKNLSYIDSNELPLRGWKKTLHKRTVAVDMTLGKHNEVNLCCVQ